MFNENNIAVVSEEEASGGGDSHVDKILLDAPCSGSGTDNVFKSNFTWDLVQKSKKTQERLLKKALKILKPGGEMVYSTCSILVKENEEVIEKVLKDFKANLVQVNLDDEIEWVNHIGCCFSAGSSFG